MFTVLSNTRNANLYMFTALTILIVVLLTFAFLPSISVNEPAAISENPARLNEALIAYHLGEKALYTNAVELSNALTAYHLGEKVIVGNALESAMLQYRLGEKAIYTNSSDLDAALAAYHRGEKETVDLREAAWITHILGEKDIQ
jgi:hypothetical protein